MGEASEPGSSRASTWGLILGLGTIYVVWGSTYLGIRIAVESIPPFLMAGARFLLAGSILLIWAKLRGAPWPARVHWRMAAVAGGLMLLGGNGGVVWAETFVPSNLAALLITTTPLWMALFDWWRPGGVRPPLSVWVGLIAGFAGMMVLATFGSSDDGKPIRLAGVVALVGASISWAAGSVFAKHAPRPDSPFMTSALQMLLGGALLSAVSLLSGELFSFQLSAVSWQSLLGLVYLIVFGSLLAMTVYTWLLHVTEPTLLATYAFVNPVIAVLLGWLLAGETLSRPTILAGAVIIAAVAWLVAVQWRYAMAQVRIRRAPRRERLPVEVSPTVPAGSFDTPRT